MIALEAARDQNEDGYRSTLDPLYERQSERDERQDPQGQAFLDAAADVGLDIAAVHAARSGGDTTMVERDLADARQPGSRGHGRSW